MEHLTIKANGADFHLVRAGRGKPLLLLHGWPEFWLTWEPVISRLSDRFMLIAPDLRGFGDSDKPDGPYGPDGHAADMLTLMDGLGIDRFAVVGHDVGGAVMQPLARQAPERLSGLFFFDFVYPGIGPRMAAPDRQPHLVSIFPPDGDGAHARRRQPRELPALYRPLPQRLGAPEERLRRCARRLRRQLLQRRQSRRRLCALSRLACRAGRDDEGRGPAASTDQRADLRALGRARPAVSLCVDRPAGRDVWRSRSRDVS
ncbi:alpha/beta fold hydrolase [Bradyrhizobium japonicum]|uniref:alpha/beta fold hydrolase n=1 Tax=Bradyrhizobium japonicum TaxID=375 RepID=UPI003BF4A783